MNAFERRGGVLHVEGVPVPELVAAAGSPVYVYSRNHFIHQYRALESALAGCGVRIFFAVKANSNVSVLRLFHKLGAGFDIVSAGELQRVMAAGAAPESVVFSGVGKSVAEIDLACKLGIHSFNVESAAELARLGERATLLQRKVRFAVRVNPDVDAATHPYISTGLKKNKFGVPAAEARRLYQQAVGHPWLEATGIACHIGSQILQSAPLLEALDSLLNLRADLAQAGIAIPQLDLGGGFGVTYDSEPPFDLDAYGSALRSALEANRQHSSPGAETAERLSVAVEPGRFLVANGGILVTTVEYLKPAQNDAGHNFAVVDAAMNDL
ncbi:MAG: diaminopimelate decarboxylase, partial [Pseudomonadales bacterium]|nr:diaminopimelate decarboxylase [Pseudomonadales bacterium]